MFLRITTRWIAVAAMGLASATASHARAPDAHTGTGNASADRFAAPGPYPVERREKALCCDGKGNAIDLYLPEQRGQPRSPDAFPVVTWGNGTWASPEKYDLLLRHLASWGIVVVATRDSSTAQGETLRDAIELLARGRDLPPVDLDRVAAIGHSQGAGGALNATRHKGRPIATVVAISLPDPRHCRKDDCARLFDGLEPGMSVLLLSGERDGLSPPATIARYAAQVPRRVAKAAASIHGADHNDIQGQPGCRPLTFGCRQGIGAFLPYVTAWLRWKLADDAAARAVFTGRDAPFATDPRLLPVAK